MLHGSRKVFMIQAHATHLGEEYEEVCEQLFTLAEVSSFIVHFEKCVVKTFKLDFQHHSNKKTGQQTYCLEKVVQWGSAGGGGGQSVRFSRLWHQCLFFKI